MTVWAFSWKTVAVAAVAGRAGVSSVPKAFDEFDGTGRMVASAHYDRMVDVMEERVRFTLLTRDIKEQLVDRYSERKGSHAELPARVNRKGP